MKSIRLLLLTIAQVSTWQQHSEPQLSKFAFLTHKLLSVETAALLSDFTCKQTSEKRSRLALSTSKIISEEHLAPKRLEELAAWLSQSPDAKEANLRLVHLGDNFAQRIGTARNQSFQRVPGCTSVVEIGVEFTKTPAEAGFMVRGWADARVARGMLAFLADGFEGASAADILRVDGEHLLKASGLDRCLPRGRINGLSNILAIIQAQVRNVVEARKHGDSASKAQSNSVEDAVQVSRRPLQVSSHESGEEIAVLLSGGVDSSVALQLIKEQGYRVRAFYLKIWLEDELAHLGTCPWQEDWEYASAVAKQLGVSLEAVSLQDEYWEQVVAYLISEAQEGRTPNPDIMCNSRIKFGMFYDNVGRHFDRIATGHYAQVLPAAADGGGDEGRVRLVQSPDPVKDQTYFLCNLRQEQLRRAMFPIGHLHKHQVRALAERHALPTQARKDSQGICFLGKLKFEDFIGHHLGTRPGPVVEYPSGRELGRHQGLWYHTTGQRKGLGAALARHVHEGPWYVVGKDVARNALLVTNRYDLVDGPRTRFHLTNINWIAGAPPPAAGDGALRVQVKVRHGSGGHAGEVKLEAGGGSGWVELGDKDAGLAPGQYAALYLGTECLGAGVISDRSFLLL